MSPYLNIEIEMNIKIGKKIGEGLLGTIYLSDIGGTPCATKVEKILNTGQDTASQHVRQVIFNDWAKKYPEYFLTLVFSGIQEMCSHNKRVPLKAGWPKKIIDELVKRNASKTCSILSYMPVLDGTFESIKHNLTKAQFLVAFNSMVKAVKLLDQAKYMHRDIHSKNIMYKKTGNEYHWYLIDYGEIWHPTFKLNSDDTYNDPPYRDIMSLMWAFCYNKAQDYMNAKKMKFPSMNTLIKRIQANPRWNDIKRYIPKGVKHKKLLVDYTMMLTIILHYELYMSALGLDPEKNKELITKQYYPEKMLKLIKGSMQ